MSASPVEHHLLTIREGQTETTYVLDASTYSIGRDPNCAIVLSSKSISRKHALLLRTPSAQGGYCYRIIDGDAQGRRSANGIQVNDESCKEKQLEHRDSIVFGLHDEVQAQYRIEINNRTLGADQRVAQYRSIKARDTDSLPTINAGDITSESGCIVRIQNLPGDKGLIVVDLINQGMVQVPMDMPQVLAALQIGDQVNLTHFDGGYLFLGKAEGVADKGSPQTDVLLPPSPPPANRSNPPLPPPRVPKTNPSVLTSELTMAKPSVVEPPMAPTLQGSHNIPASLKTEIETQAKLYRRCYETVIREMGDLQLNEDHYIAIASYIMGTLTRQPMPPESTGDIKIQRTTER